MPASLAALRAVSISFFQSSIPVPTILGAALMISSGVALTSFVAAFQAS